MMKTTRTAIALAAMVSLAACANNAGPKEIGGTLIGAGLCGLAGSQIGSGTGQLAAVGAGVLLCGLIGREVGRSLDKADQLYVQQAEQKAHVAPIGGTIAWNNPDTGNYGTYTPTREGTNTATGNYCREYQTTVTIDGQTQQAHGTACREPDGTWRTVN